MLKRIAIAFSCIALTACSSTRQVDRASDVTSFYDYQLFSSSSQPIHLSSLPKEILDADVILIGEWHTHSGIHRFQTDLLKQLISDNHAVAISMEQFSRNKQDVVDQYLSSEIGEQVLIKQGGAWPNYESDYRPLIELAKANDIDVIAANAPKPVVRCIGQQGLSYLDKLEPLERQYLAHSIDVSESPYKEKFMASMHHGTPEQTEIQYAAQVAWDETMAESITRYLSQHANKQVIHIAGKFHVEQGLGTKSSILKRNPDLNVVVITPTDTLTTTGSDYQLNVLPPPERYVQMENRLSAYKELSQRNQDMTCL